MRVVTPEVRDLLIRVRSELQTIRSTDHQSWAYGEKYICHAAEHLDPARWGPVSDLMSSLLIEPFGHFSFSGWMFSRCDAAGVPYLDVEQTNNLRLDWLNYLIDGVIVEDQCTLAGRPWFPMLDDAWEGYYNYRECRYDLWRNGIKLGEIKHDL